MLTQRADCVYVLSWIGFTCKETVGRKTSSVIANFEGKRQKAKAHGKSVHPSHARGGNTHGG
jgi:hypothetical protein